MLRIDYIFMFIGLGIVMKSELSIRVDYYIIDTHTHTHTYTHIHTLGVTHTSPNRVEEKLKNDKKKKNILDFLPKDQKTERKNDAMAMKKRKRKRRRRRKRRKRRKRRRRRRRRKGRSGLEKYKRGITIEIFTRGKHTERI